ncbi:hypothetical protein BGZ95_005517, partial [Linnemannia exigua]
TTGLNHFQTRYIRTETAASDTSDRENESIKVYAIEIYCSETEASDKFDGENEGDMTEGDTSSMAQRGTRRKRNKKKKRCGQRSQSA